jgi:hypothetical protein
MTPLPQVVTAPGPDLLGRVPEHGHRPFHNFKQPNRKMPDRHCEEPTGRANARPTTGSATKQSRLSSPPDGLLRFARNDVGDRAKSPRSRGAMRPRFARTLSLREQRAQGKPGVRCTRSRACSVGSTRVSHHEFTGNIRLSPRNGFNGFLRALPGDRALLPPSLTDNSANLTPASGCQDHTTSPSARVSFARALSCTDTVASTASRSQRP